ncbi:hypothetical protein OIO90_004340 [Microbotryomycetes sp. JL221]|nr:hypothetical protein OIO90_004340 [Microbotryomycetes sp. JL221]
MDNRHTVVVRAGTPDSAQRHSLNHSNGTAGADQQQQQQPHEVIVASPAFLAALRPPPLPIWAVGHTTKALTTSRISLVAAKRCTNFGFDVARTGTSFGFAIARAVAKGVGTVIDSIAGGPPTSAGVDTRAVTETGQVIVHDNEARQLGQTPIAKAMSWPVDGAEQLALFGINLGSNITNLVFSGVQSSVQWLEEVYGNDEAVRTLEAFLKLVQREWTTSLPTDPYSEGGLSRWNIVQVGKAAATWAALQTVTREWEGSRIAPELEELDLATWGRGAHSPTTETAMVWEVTDEELLETGEEIIEARTNDDASDFASEIEQLPAEDKLRAQLRRFSKMCLGSYGGMGVVFFGVNMPAMASESSAPSTEYGTPLTSADISRIPSRAFIDPTGSSPEARSVLEQTTIVEDRLGDLQRDYFEDYATATEDTATSNDLANELGLKDRSKAQPSWWQLLTGAHDSKVFRSLGEVDMHATTLGREHDESTDEEDEDEDYSTEEHLARKRARQLAKEARLRKEMRGRRPPRFFVVTDYPNQSVNVVLRGTLSVDDVATDLACEPASFDETLYWDRPANASNTTVSQSSQADPSASRQGYQVHGGMYEMAIAMGGRDGPLTRAVARALRNNPTFDLFLGGHSLGAGVASMLGLMWADPDSCKTTERCGLPAGRKVKVFGFATPCVASPELALRSKKLIHSFVYSGDVISRFSLGHMRDIRSAATWLCYANSNPDAATENILSRIIAYKTGRLDSDPVRKREAEIWFTSLRSTLEANQIYADLFPPGDILWLTAPGDIKLPWDDDRGNRPPNQSPRLFKVGRPEVVFKQIQFSQTMLSSHLPHKYTEAIDAFL